MTRRAMFGVFALPFLGGQAGPFVLASGKLDAAPHEAADGYFNCSRLSIAVPPDGTPAQILREHLTGGDVEIVIRRKAGRTLGEVGR